MGADTTYLNQINLSYFVNKGIDGLIPTRKQSKEKIGKINPKPSHKDNLYYNLRPRSFHVLSRTTNVLLQRMHTTNYIT